MILLLTFMAQWPKKDLTFNQGGGGKQILSAKNSSFGATLTSLKIIDCCMIQT